MPIETIRDLFAKFDKTLLWATAFVLGCLGVVIWDQEFQWRSREDYAFGYLVPVFFAYVLYDRWEEIRAILLGETPPNNSTDDNSTDDDSHQRDDAADDYDYDAADAAQTRRSKATSTATATPTPTLDNLVFYALVASLFSFAIGAIMCAVNGTNIMATYFNTNGFIGLAIGTLWLFSAKDATGRLLSTKERIHFLRLFTFPILVWFISGPMLYIMDTSVRTVLLFQVTNIIVAILQSAGFDVTASANVITLPNILPTGQRDLVGIDDACSGVRSLTACIFMGAFLSAIFVKGPIRKLVLLGLSLVSAIVLNLVRTGFLTIWAYKNGSKGINYDLWLNNDKSPDFTLGTVHDIAGYVAMAFTFLLLLLSIPLVNLHLRRTTSEMRR